MALNFGKYVSTIANLGQRLGFNKPRPPGEGFYIYGLLFFIAYLVADSGALYLRTYMLPSGQVASTKAGGFSKPAAGSKTQRPSEVSTIVGKNIFNADHIIAKSIKAQKKPGSSTETPTDDPVKSSLPLDLVGTIIHGMKNASVATVQIKGKKEILSYKAEEKIGSMATVVEIVRNKVIFRNHRKGKRLEFIEIKDNNRLKIGVKKSDGPSTAVVEPEKKDFSLTRVEVDKAIGNLSAILQDAKAVPYIAPGSGGKVSGFKLVAIKAGSIYEKLGLKRGDILRGVNGEEVNSPQKAMELYQALKGSDKIELEITRDGSASTLNYDITK